MDEDSVSGNAYADALASVYFAVMPANACLASPDPVDMAARIRHIVGRMKEDEEEMRDRIAFLLTALDQATNDAVVDADGFIGEAGGCNHSKYGHVNDKPEMGTYIRDREQGQSRR